MPAGNNAEIYVIRGKTSFAKIIGDPVLNYSKDGKEWKMDLKIDANTVKEVKKMGLGDRVKQKEGYLDGAPFMTFKQKEFKSNGEPNQPIKVVDVAGNPWDQNKLIGNDSVVDVKFVKVDFGPGKKLGVYPRSVRVLELVEYSPKEFDDLDENDEFYENVVKAKAKRQEELVQFRKDFDIADDDELDDDIEI